MKRIAVLCTLLLAAALVASPVAQAAQPDDRLTLLEQQNRDLVLKLDKLQTQVNDLVLGQKYHLGGVGASVIGGNVGVEANLRPIAIGYYPGAGKYIALQGTIEFWRVNWRWLSLGAWLNDGRPLTASECSRSWDIMAASVVDVRLWKGMAARIGVRWFFPNPSGPFGDAKRHAQESVDSVQKQVDDLKKAVDSIKSGNVAGAQVPSGQADTSGFDKAGDDIKRPYSEAAKAPQMEFGLRWLF